MSTYTGFLVKCGCTGMSPSAKRWVEITQGRVSYFVDQTKSVLKGICNFDVSSKIMFWPDIGSNTHCIAIFTEDSELFFSTGDETLKRAIVKLCEIEIRSVIKAALEKDPNAIVNKVPVSFSFSECNGNTDDALRRNLYSVAGIPEDWLKITEIIGRGKPELRLADHAWGCIPPYALYKVCQRIYALYTRCGQLTWGTIAVSSLNYIII